MKERILAWDACTNVRDLGGLKTRDGRITRRGMIVRSDSPSKLTEAGWSSLYAHGIRTIITLYTHGHVEDKLNFSLPYSDVATLRVAIEDVTNKSFVQQWASTDLWCTPLYYKDALQRWPVRHAAAISAIAQAQAGGVLFHCVRGNDRTGIITLLLLSLVGVSHEDLIADYELSPDAERDEILAREQSSVRDAVGNALAGLDVESYLLKGGVSADDLSAIRQRLLE